MIPDAMNRLARNFCRATHFLILSRIVGSERITIYAGLFEDHDKAAHEAHVWKSSGWDHLAEIHCIDPHDEVSAIND